MSAPQVDVKSTAPSPSTNTDTAAKAPKAVAAANYFQLAQCFIGDELAPVLIADQLTHDKTRFTVSGIPHDIRGYSFHLRYPLEDADGASVIEAVVILSSDAGSTAVHPVIEMNIGSPGKTTNVLSVDAKYMTKNGLFVANDDGDYEVKLRMALSPRPANGDGTANPVRTIGAQCYSESHGAWIHAAYKQLPVSDNDWYPEFIVETAPMFKGIRLTPPGSK